MAIVISKHLKEFIIRHRWEYEFPLTKDIKLVEDLDINGDDAIDFLLAFSEEFNVDLSKFEIAKYIKGEGFKLSKALSFFGIIKTDKKYLSITLGDLEKAIEKGKLDDSIIGR